MAAVRAAALQDPAKTFLSTTNVHGTPQYMAPEQFAGAHCDEKVDVFALATILNECATRRPPWRDFGNAFQVRTSSPESPARPCVVLITIFPVLRLPCYSPGSSWELPRDGCKSVQAQQAMRRVCSTQARMLGACLLKWHLAEPPGVRVCNAARADHSPGCHQGGAAHHGRLYARAPQAPDR